MLTGQNGILTQAQRAKTETENAANNEAAILEEYNKYLNNAVGGTSTKPEDTVNAKDVLIPDENGATEEEKSPYVLYNNLLCRAFYNDDTHGLQIITNDSIETFDIYSLAEESAMKSYNEAVNKLNDKAKKYMGKKAIDARCLGSLAILKEGKFQGDTSGMFNDSRFEDWSGEFKDADSNYVEDTNRINSLKIYLEDETWLASRYIEVENDEKAKFYVRSLRGYDEISLGLDLFIIYSYDKMSEISTVEGAKDFRPIFLLSTNTQIVSGNGSKDNPYVIE